MLTETRGMNTRTVDELRKVLHPDQLDEIYQVFAEHARRRIQRIQTMADASEVRREAHSLRGSAEMLGAQDLAVMAAGLEVKAVTGEPLRQSASAMLEALESFLGAVAAIGVRL